jgi:hypothetical protein
MVKYSCQIRRRTWYLLLPAFGLKTLALLHELRDGCRKVLELFAAKPQFGGGDVLLQVSDGRGARNGKHHRGAHQKPGERYLTQGGVVPSGYLFQQRLVLELVLYPRSG